MAFGAGWAVLVGAAWYLVPRWALLWVLITIVFLLVMMVELIKEDSFVINIR
ncbi:MAG: hypothetical protein IMZ58_08180 [Thermoplasmata archaeon]|nr:hypothetical protein [Thermoplasmata archaeon]